MDGNPSTNMTADERVRRHITSVFAQIRDAIENGDVLPKDLYGEPGISSSTVSRIMDTGSPTPGDIYFSTLFNLLDRLSDDQRYAAIEPILNDLQLRALPKREIDADVNQDGHVDATDARESAVTVNRLVTEMVNSAISAVEDGHVDESERAALQRIRSAVFQSQDTLMVTIETIAMSAFRRKCRQPRLAT